jgi:colicin import membrane protein
VKLPFDRNQPGLAVSAGVHVALLVATLVAFSQTEAFEDAAEAVPVEVVSASEFSEITRGEKTGK